MDHQISKHEEAGLLSVIASSEHDIQGENAGRSSSTNKKRRLAFYVPLLILAWWIGSRIPAVLSWVGRDTIQPVLSQNSSESEIKAFLDFDDVKSIHFI